ncbi:MAG: N-6 DNA methylase, partial [Bdellovibrionales bacterium]|nr:N-6 DNA methylase [Bdellovibrionales bacterium]
MLNTQIINKYIYELKPRLDKILRTNSNEENIRPVFIELLNRCGSHKDLWVVTEDRVKNNKKPDGAIKNYYTIHGYWEAKSPDKNLDKEIEQKQQLGYPLNNTIFENSSKCVLFQNGQVCKEIQKDMWSDKALGELLSLFFNFQTPEITNFNKAKSKFFERQTLSALIKEIKEELHNLGSNVDYLNEIDVLVNECKKFINPYFERKNVEQWLIQHILTEQIFLKVFDEQQYLEQNNISKSIKKIEEKFLLNKKQEIVNKIKPYINPIANFGTKIKDLNEKQLFLKDVYQNFYKSYDDRVAGEFGVVYTPNEIVKFIVRSTDFLLRKHFDKGLEDKGIHILDPATGTGTFITELMQHIHYSDDSSLEYKYDNEIHANEHMVLPYYVANLNIEYIFQKLTEKRRPFKNLVLMDTLENSATLKGQMTFSGQAFEKNQQKVKHQNEKTIYVIMGNPPWVEYSDHKDSYPELRKAIKDTYVYNLRKYQKNRKTVKPKIPYNKYSMFLRWASDRIDKEGIISFIVNRSFIDGDSATGIRASLEEEFDYIYVIDLGGSLVAGDPQYSNVFEGIRTGNCIVFLIKNNDGQNSIKLSSLKKLEKLKKDDGKLKLSNLHNFSIEKYMNNLESVIPDSEKNWIKKTQFDGFYVGDLFSKTQFGVCSQRDRIIIKKSKSDLIASVKKFLKEIKKNGKNATGVNRNLAARILSGKHKFSFDKNKISKILFRQNGLAPIFGYLDCVNLIYST